MTAWSAGTGRTPVIIAKLRQHLLVQTASVNVDCRKAEWIECFILCIIDCHTPVRIVKEDEESRSEPHGTPKHNSELCSRIAHYSTSRNRHFWRDTTDTPLALHKTVISQYIVIYML